MSQYGLSLLRESNLQNRLNYIFLKKVKPVALQSLYISGIMSVTNHVHACPFRIQLNNHIVRLIFVHSLVLVSFYFKLQTIHRHYIT